MKYAFSTLACPAWSIEQVAEAATRMGYNGVELRLLDGNVIDPVTDRLKVIRATAICREHGLEVCALDTSCTFNYANPEERARQMADLRNWIRLAKDVQVPLLRVFGGSGQSESIPPPSDQEVNEWVAQSLRQVAHEAEQALVTIALETHDAFSSAHRVAEVLRAVDSAYVAALWDSHHPYRVGETAQEVIKVLGTRLAHVHVKDARRVTPAGSAWQLTLLGEGEVPVREQLELLVRHRYTGYVSVEWEKNGILKLPNQRTLSHSTSRGSRTFHSNASRTKRLVRRYETERTYGRRCHHF